MISTYAVPTCAEPALSTRSTLEAIAAWLVRRRVRLTLAIFVALVAEDVLTGVKPHSVLDIRDPATAFGLSLVLLGVLIRSWAAGVLHKTWELTTTGPYSIIRNPLYVGSFLIMTGYAALIDDFENIYVILGPLAFLYYLQVLQEERNLSKKYEARWQEYARETPRFLPGRLPRLGTLFSTWSLRDWLGSREYRALGATLLGLAALELWRRW
jgi:protein-S-isoprenylcysteine O-methyltransferase Ste14